MSYKTLDRCIVCGKKGVDLHHMSSRGSGGDDNSSNLIPLCRFHHSEIHTIGRTTFVKKYVSVYIWMVRNKWKLCALTNKWYSN